MKVDAAVLVTEGPRLMAADELPRSAGEVVAPLLAAYLASRVQSLSVETYPL